MDDLIFVTFGDGPKGWRDAAKRLARDVNSFTNPMATLNLQIKDISYFNPSIGSQINNLAKQYKRGYGYWSWKAAAVNLASHLFPNKYILYIDAGSSLNLVENASAIWTDWRNFVEEHGALAWQLNNHPEYAWTKKELLDRLNVGDRIVTSNQIQSGFVFLAPNMQNKSLLKEWQELSLEESGFFLTDEIKIQQHPNFLEHRHDQSILSLIWKKLELSHLLDTTDPIRNLSDSPILATRNNTFLSWDSPLILRKNISRANSLIDKCTQLLKKW